MIGAQGIDRKDDDAWMMLSARARDVSEEEKDGDHAVDHRRMVTRCYGETWRTPTTAPLAL
jgi:hypothetical protein